MKNHISPITVFISLITFSLFTCIYAASALSFGTTELNVWSVVLLSFSIVCIFLQIYLTFKINRNKKVSADEYTTQLQYRSAYYSFILISFLIGMLFIGIGAMITLNLSSANNLSQLLNVKVILGIISIIQLIGLTSYTYLYFRFDKQGN